MFEVITDRLWQRELRRARGYSNSISAQIKMKLHPANPTPGYEPKQPRNMITFEPIVTPSGKGAPEKEHTSFSCRTEGRTLGYLHPQEDGLYRFYPNHLIGMSWHEGMMKEIAFKMDALNLPQAIEATD